MSSYHFNFIVFKVMMADTNLTMIFNILFMPCTVLSCHMPFNIFLNHFGNYNYCSAHFPDAQKYVITNINLQITEWNSRVSCVLWEGLLEPHSLAHTHKPHTKQWIFTCNLHQLSNKCTQWKKHTNNCSASVPDIWMKYSTQFRPPTPAIEHMFESSWLYYTLQ